MQPLILSLMLAGGVGRSDALASTFREAMHPDYAAKLALDREFNELQARYKVLRAANPVDLNLLLDNLRHTRAVQQRQVEVIGRILQHDAPFPWKRPRTAPARPADGGR